MAFNSTYIESFQTKHRSNVGFTSSAKEVSNEANALINPHQVNAAQIPIIDVVATYGPLVASGIAAGVVEKHTIKLTVDPTVNDNKAWYADEANCVESGHTGSGRITNFMRVAGSQYKLRLFGDNGAGTAPGTEIFTTEANFNWDYDAAAGTVFMDANPGSSKTLPLWAEIYVYVGETVADKLDTTSSGTVGDNYYTKGQLDGGQLDNRYYTETEVDSLLSSNLSSANSYTDSEISTLSGTLSSAISSGDSSTLSSAQSYADGVASTAESNANAYTDSEISTLSGTLQTALNAQDEFIELIDTPSSYSSNRAGYMVRVNDTYDGLDFESTIVTDASGNTTIFGNLSVSGTLFTVDHETVQVSDNIITVNYGETGAGVTNVFGGIEVDRGTSENYFFVFNEDTDWFEIGTSGTLQPVATRTTITENYIPFGNSQDQYTESSYLTWNNSTRSMLVDGSLTLNYGSTVDEFSTDTTLSGSSNSAVPTENAVKTYVDAGDAATLSSAQSYTDSEISTLSGTLQAAIDAQDEFIELSDTPSSYNDTKILMSTASAIAYTTDLSWNEFTNALTITSGTFGFTDKGTTINEFSIDGTLSGDSDSAVPTEKAVKAYVDAKAAAQNSFIELSDTPLSYTAQRLLYTTASGVEFSDGVTWNESTNAMVIGGTLALSVGTAVNEFSTDTTLSGNSDSAVPTEKAVKTYVDARDAATLSSANSYADSGDSSTLSSAQSYADGVASTAESNANAYTDAEISTLSGTLQAAIDAQDTFIELSDTPAAYVAQKLLFTTGSSVEFASNLNWSGSLLSISGSLSVSNQLTLASGTAATEISNDATMADSSSTALVTESAVKGYVDSAINDSRSYMVNLTKNGSVWEYNGGFSTVPDNLVVYLNGVMNKSNDTEYYSAAVSGGKLQITFTYATTDEDWVTASYGNIQGGMFVTRWQTKIANYQSASGDRIMVDTSATGSNGSEYTITLPVSPNVGDVVYVFDAGGNCATTNVIVGRNGSNIMGSASDLSIDVDEASVELVYYNSSKGWRLV